MKHWRSPKRSEAPLAPHTDRKEAFDPTAWQLLKNREVVGQGGLVDPCRKNLLRSACQNGHRREAIVRALLNAEHSINETRLQRADSQTTNNPSPLGSIDRCLQTRSEHPLLHTEIQLILLIEIADTAVGLAFHPIEVLMKEGTGLADISNPARITETAITAEVLGRTDPIAGNRPRLVVGKR